MFDLEEVVGDVVMEISFCMMMFFGVIVGIYGKCEDLSLCLVEGINESILSLLVKLLFVKFISLILLGRLVKFCL